jgi:hypothetical protein
MQVVAGVPPTMVFTLRPVFNHPSGSYNTTLYNNSDIVGRRLTISGCPGRIYFNAFLRDWDPNGDGPFLRTWETYIDATTYMNGMGTALLRAVEACAGGPPGNAECVADFGEEGPTCSLGTCTFAWNKTTPARPDGINRAAPVAPCASLVWQTGNLSNPGGHNFFGVLDQASPGVCTGDGAYPCSTDQHCSGLDQNQPPQMGPGGTCQFATNCGLPDPGVEQYLGSWAMDVQAGAEGLYSIGMQAGLTYGQDDNILDRGGAQNIPILALENAEVNVPTGSCCFGIGTPGAGCNNDLTECECLALPALAQFEAGGACDNPPTDDGCCACLTNGDCNDNDLCTNDTCNNCVCSNVNVPTWDPLTECCDAATGAQCTPTVTNTCETAACSLPGNRGVCQNTDIADGSPCTGDDNGEGATNGDGNPCTYDDTCTGGACSGTDITSANINCTTTADCLAATDVGDGTGATGASCQSGFCVCSLVPDADIIVVSGETKDEDADSVCVAEDSKLTVRIHISPATAPINGGQFLITYDPSCLAYNSAVGVPPYTDQVFGPIVNQTAGTIFTVVGVGFGGAPNNDGFAGNADMVELSFDKIGACTSCQICFDSNNPQNTYLVDDSGQRVDVVANCSKLLISNNVLDITTPGPYIKTNVDCDEMTATPSWATPTVSDSCGNASLSCSGESADGTVYGQGVAMNGGTIGVGVTNFCCTATSDWCDKTAEECWTVEVNDRTSLDVKVALSPSTQSKPGDNLTRCIKFTLYPNTIQAPFYFEEEITFGGQFEFIGKSKDLVKIPGHGRWDCITAWDQLHTLRSCYLFDDDDCVDGVLHAEFAGDPAFGGNWLISGNLDGWKKSGPSGPVPARDFNIDILDYGTLQATWGSDYGTGDTDCDTAGPHGDIDGDGLVGLSDYAFISMNFLASAKECCGVEVLPAGANNGAITEISVQDLRLMGLGDLAAGDLNGDGLLNVDDMNAFNQGARPAVKGMRGVRKDGGTR